MAGEQFELEQASSRYHTVAAWVAVIFNPVFAITDYYNIPHHWQALLTMRLCVSLMVLLTLMARKQYRIPSHVIAFVPFILISLENSYVYLVLGSGDLLGQNLNYIALLLGAGLFVLWHWSYSVVMVAVFLAATSYFLWLNPGISIHQFFVNGGLLLGVVAIFMVLLIQTRYALKKKEIAARLALRDSNEQLRLQTEKVTELNENLEKMVRERTMELERKNKALEEYAFINAHQLRAPVASILGLTHLLSQQALTGDQTVILQHLKNSTEKLDGIVRTIRESIETA